MCDHCPSGFAGNGESCVDVDDCHGHPCGHNGNCTDTGTHSYDCACESGYLFTAGTCEEIRPCETGEADCHANATCAHAGPGEYSCACTTGFSGNGTDCIDTDDCVDSPCFPGVECTDVPAPGHGFQCDMCPDGFMSIASSGTGEDCRDIDDCHGNPCGIGGNCTDTGAVSYTCDCGSDYGYDANAGTCVQLLKMTIAASFEDVTANPEALEAFKDEFSSGLASMLGVDSSRVLVIGVSPGSVVVDFIITSPPPSSNPSAGDANSTDAAAAAAAAAAGSSMPSVEELVQQFTEAKASGTLGSVGSYQSLPDPLPPGPPAPSITVQRSRTAAPPPPEEEGGIGGALGVMFVLLLGVGGGLFAHSKMARPQVDMKPVSDDVEKQQDQDGEETDNPLAASGGNDAAAAATAAANAAIAASAAAAAAAQAAAHAASFAIQGGGSGRGSNNLTEHKGESNDSENSFGEEQNNPMAEGGSDSDEEGGGGGGGGGRGSSPGKGKLAGTMAFDVEESSRPRGGASMDDDVGDDEMTAAAPGAVFDVEEPSGGRRGGKKFGGKMKKMGGKGKTMGGKGANLVRGMGGGKAGEDEGIDASDALASMKKTGFQLGKNENSSSRHLI